MENECFLGQDCDVWKEYLENTSVCRSLFYIPFYLCFNRFSNAFNLNVQAFEYSVSGVPLSADANRTFSKLFDQIHKKMGDYAKSVGKGIGAEKNKPGSSMWLQLSRPVFMRKSNPLDVCSLFHFLFI